MAESARRPTSKATRAAGGKAERAGTRAEAKQRTVTPKAMPHTRTRQVGAGAKNGGSRERILTAALEIFSERGFDGSTTRDIAARAGVNLGLIKYYFDSKEKLWRAAIDRIFESLWAALAPDVPAELGDRESIAELLRECVRFAARNPAFVRLMNDEGKRDSPRMRWLVDRHGKRMFELVTTLLESGRASALVPDVPVLHLYYALLGSIGLIFSQAPECRRLTGKDPAKTEAMTEAHADALVKIYVGGSPDVRARDG